MNVAALKPMMTWPVRLEALPMVNTDDLFVKSDYVVRYYMPLVGPGQLAMLRLIADDRGRAYRLVDFAGMLGYGESSRRLAAVLDRGAGMGMLKLDVPASPGDLVLSGRVWLPRLSPSQIERLPVPLRDELRRAHTVKVDA